jgi:tRNA threonylcarbamoyladenosine biosynthesis protein TsaB
MIVLAIDAGLGGFSAAAVRDSETLAAVELSGQVALEQGLPAVSTVLRQAQLTPARIDRLGVGVGPGSFTGVRIAISYAKSLAQGWNVPLAGVNSFDAIEAGIHLDGPILTVVRGRKGVVSVRYRQAAGVFRASGYVSDVLDQLAGLVRDNVAVLGDAEDVLPGLAERGWSVQKVPRVIEPAALSVAVITARREPARSLHEVRADYGELPAARVPKSL